MPTTPEFPSQELGNIAPYLAEGAELQLLRSISARENPVKSSNGGCEKRRSTSYDESHGQFACVAESIEEGFSVDQSEVSKKGGSKENSWHSRVWRWKRGAKGQQHTEDSSLRSLTAGKEKEESTVPKWKKMLLKLKSKAMEAHKSAICTSNLDLQVANYDQLGMRKEIKSKNPAQQAEKQRPYSVYPEPVLSRRSSTAAPIWERRNAAQPTTLDLRNLKITGLKHLPRPHQHRG